MKKLFTFIFAAALAVSCWSTDITIGSGTDANTYIPTNFKSEYSVVELLYPKATLTSLEGQEAITHIQFNLKQNITSSMTRKWKIYMSLNSNYSTTGTTMDAGTNLVFDGDVVISKIGWFDIELQTSFKYAPTSSTKALQIIIYDHTSSSSSSWERSCYGTNTSSNQSAYKNSSSAMTPTSSISSASAVKFLPNIQFICGGSTPEPEEPELTATCSNPDFGTFAKEYETRSTTITVTGKNLTENVTVSAADGMTVDPASLTKEAVMATGGATVTVTTNSSFVSGKKVTISSGKIEKSVTFTGNGDPFEERIAVSYLAGSAIGSYSLLTATAKIESVEGNTFIIGTGSNACSIDYSAVPGTYEVLGSVKDLKVKRNQDYSFKAFAFTYIGGKTISETSTNNNITYGTVTNVTLNRTLVADGFYSTICLPFTVSKEQIEEQFGAETVVQELASASLSDNDTELTLNFEERDTIGAGKPYLIKPAKGGTSFTFTGVKLDNTPRNFTSDNLDFIGGFNQSTLEVGVKNVLLLSGEDKLGWAETSGTFKGLRAYFKVKYHSAAAPARLNTRIIFDNTTKIQEIQNNATRISDVHKFVNNGQLIIIRNGVKYNAQGARL